MIVFSRRHLALALAAACPALWAADAPKIALPAPQTEGGKPLMQALKERKSSREFAPDPLPLQTLSNLLWAAAGQNRPGGQRTAPSAMNAQEVDVYVVLPQGAYVYQAKGHALQPVAGGDLRALAGSQPFVATAPLNLVYVADFAKMRGSSTEDKITYSAAGAGFIGQNTYLYCASEGLATVVRAMVDRPALAKALNLRADQKIILSQTVGFPKK
jgi:SagB-type dehydrogenase family enzyme